MKKPLKKKLRIIGYLITAIATALVMLNISNPELNFVALILGICVISIIAELTS